MANELDTEIATFNEHLPTLISHLGKFVVIKGEKIEGIYDTYSDALKFGYQKFKLEPFLVKKISPSEQVLFFTRDFSQPCQV
ncbi:hypothetical protein FK216_06010 [Moraxellaceae bacterium AER2_44_116]|nr:hypothetical protein [Moraxellaceae bacterium]TQC98411.1 hypothetical protein FK216_06010 [Moraxellaceae bacterium AER2_44_116]